MHDTADKAARITKNQGNMTLPKITVKLITGPEEMKMLETAQQIVQNLDQKMSYIATREHR